MFSHMYYVLHTIGHLPRYVQASLFRGLVVFIVHYRHTQRERFSLLYLTVGRERTTVPIGTYGGRSEETN